MAKTKRVRQKVRKFILLVSMLIFPITINYFSPYLIIQGSFEGVLSGSALLFAGLFLTSLFFGRAFCGWVCPAGSLQEVCSSISSKAASRKQNIIKYIIWIPWLLAIVAGFIAAGGLKQLNIIYYTDYGISVNAPTGYIIYFFVVGLIVFFSLIFGKRAFCHSLCWMAPFMVVGNFIKEKLHIPAFRLKADLINCSNCKICEKNCPMSLPVNKMVTDKKMFNKECILCGNCADNCPNNVIKLGVYKK